MAGADQHTLPFAGDLYGEMLLAEQDSGEAKRPPLTALVPGLLIVAVAAAAAAWLSDHYGFPIILLGLLTGLSLNFVALEPRTHAGLDFVSRTGLRVGIVILGLQVSVAQVRALGPLPFAALIVVMALTFIAGGIGARLSGQSRYAGILAGGATAICGASAALALYSIIGKQRLSQAQFSLTLVGISMASALAMSIYPVIASQIGLNHAQAGFLIGASIHDVAQAIGGGYAFSDQAGAYATIVKLTRVALLAPVIAIASVLLAEPDAAGVKARRFRLALPWFISLFLVVAAINSLVTIPAAASHAALNLSKALLLLAVTATAMRSRLDLLMQLGWKAAIPVAAATLTSFVTALGFAWLL